MYRGLDKIVDTVRSVHAAPLRCGLRPGSTADGHGMPRIDGVAEYLRPDAREKDQRWTLARLAELIRRLFRVS